MDNFSKIYSLCEEHGINAKYDVSMKNLTTFKIGGNAKLYAEAENSSHVSELIKACRKYDVDYIVIGKGSNIVVTLPRRREQQPFRSRICLGNPGLGRRRCVYERGRLRRRD